MTMLRYGRVFVADNARVLGEVTLGDDCSIWPGAAIRGDVAAVVLGQMSNVQDCAVVHCDSGAPNVIGSRVTIGHGAIVHGMRVGDDTLIGMGATVLGRTVIGKGCLIAAGAVVPPGLEVPDGMVVMGVPGKIVRPVNDKERQYMKWLPAHYAELAKLHHAEPEHPRVRPWRGNAAGIAGDAMDSAV